MAAVCTCWIPAFTGSFLAEIWQAWQRWLDFTQAEEADILCAGVQEHNGPHRSLAQVIQHALQCTHALQALERRSFSSC